MTTAQNLQSYYIAPDAPIRDAMQLIENNRGKIALVVDEQHILLGAITDGDIRRALLSGSALETPVKMIMNKNPLTADETAERARIFSMMQSKQIRNVPIVDKQKRVVDLINLSDILTAEKMANPVVIMAGGLGKRLMPLTENVPKPMLEVGGTPVLEILLNSFITQGFEKFYISVNYLADQIKTHFKDGAQYGASITYLEEDRPLDTAGALSLLPPDINQPFLVINGDIITNVKFRDLLDYHVLNKAAATIGVREHRTQVPYGVVTLEDNRVVRFEEKPVKTHFVNTGIYVLDPAAQAFLGKNQPMTMPALLEKMQAQNKKIAAYPVTEYWLDIGRMEDFSRAEKEFLNNIENPRSA